MVLWGLYTVIKHSPGWLSLRDSSPYLEYISKAEGLGLMKVFRTFSQKDAPVLKIFTVYKQTVGDTYLGLWEGGS